MNGFAGGCNILKTVTIRGDFPKLEIIRGMFQGCSELQQITFENCQLSNVEDMTDMFQHSGIREVYFGDMDLNNIVECYGVFEDASKLTKIVTKLPNISRKQLNKMRIPRCVKDNLKIVCNYKQ